MKRPTKTELARARAVVAELRLRGDAARDSDAGEDVFWRFYERLIADQLLDGESPRALVDHVAALLEEGFEAAIARIRGESAARPEAVGA